MDLNNQSQKPFGSSGPFGINADRNSYDQIQATRLEGDQNNIGPFRQTAPGGFQTQQRQIPTSGLQSAVPGPFGQMSQNQPANRTLRIPQMQQGENNMEQRGLLDIPGEKDAKKKQKINQTFKENQIITLNQIDQNDKIEADTEMTDYDDSLIKALEMQPLKVRTFLENLKNGDFIEVSEKYIQSKLMTKKDVEVSKSQSENLFLELNEIIHHFIRFLDRFIFFFQGLLAGMSMMHLVFIYLNPDPAQTLESYSVVALKIDQVFHIFAFISCFGSLFIAYKIKQQVDISQRRKDRQIYLQSVLSCLCFSTAYLFNLINHKFIALISDSIPGISDPTNLAITVNSFESGFTQFQIFQIVITALTLLGWYISVNTTESNLDFMIQFEHNDMMILEETRDSD